MAEKFAHLDLTVTADYNKDALLIEYTKLMIEGIVNEDKMLEVEAIKSLGDVYLKRGTETRQTTCLTKATALYNTALARCEGVQGTVALIQRLLYTARIRQGMGKTGNKSPKHSGQLNRSHHLSRDLPGTSRSSDAIAGTTCQQFGTSSAAYIASQTPRHTTPDYRSYEEHLTTGDRALTDGKLDLAERKFASALKLIHDRNEPDRPREADCLSRLGDVYVQTGKRTKEGRKFTQAAALYNAAMARTKANEHKVMKSLQNTEQSFLLHTANVDSEPSPSDSAIRHQKRLEDMRVHVKSQLDAIDQQENPYQYDEDDPAMVTVEAKRAEAVKALCKTIAKDRQMFIQDLVDECISTIGPPPCKHAFVGLGSQATELVTPYSDLEFAILIEDGKDNEDTRRYFTNLTHYLHLKVINLGETILPAMAIPSLNDFQSEDRENNWFYDSVTPHGFAFDGFMPWASKTPFGRDKTKTRPPVSLIQTPAEMTKFQQLEISLSEGYHLSDMLRRFVFLAGDEELVNQYRKILMESITDDLLSHCQSQHLVIFFMNSMLEMMGQDPTFEPGTGQLLKISRKDIEKIGQIPAFEPTGQLLNVKKEIYRFPGIAIELLALYCNITLLASTWNVINEMKEAGWIHKEDAAHLTVLTSISAELRLRTYMANGGQTDSMSPLAKIDYQTKTHDATLKSAFHIPDTKILFRYYCRAVPLRMCMPDLIQAGKSRFQPRRVFETAIFDTSNECMGRIAGTLLLFDKAIHHLEAALRDAGSNVEKRAKILHNLGWSWAEMGDQKKAISYYQQAQTLNIKVHGSSAHPDTAKSLYQLGLAHKNLGDYKKAISYCEQALAMIKAVYEDVAHDVAAGCLNTLGSSWRKLGDRKRAISYYEQFLAMTKTLVGSNKPHLDIAGAFNNLGICCLESGDHNGAIIYWENALKMMKAIYGDNTAHPGIAMALSNLGSAWRELGDHEKAIDYLERSLTMLKTIHGEAHPDMPDIARSLLNLGMCWSKHGNQEKAIEYCQQSLTMRKTIYGDSTPHPDIAMSLHNLGSCLIDDPTKAISYFEQALKMREAIFGSSNAHPDIAKSLHCLGLCCSAIGKEHRAISYYERSLTITKVIYRDNMAHPNIVALLKSLASSWSVIGDHMKAMSYFEQAQAASKVTP
ncbi:uncharacterized protein [Branchiostoma lanceolatum]|uniref:uncharacterized protein n=1 Tax=Branchiostoma lanceolatum TaxID=7740 RepID=UPI003452FD76